MFNFNPFNKKPKIENVAQQQSPEKQKQQSSLLRRVLKSKYTYLIPLALAVAGERVGLVPDPIFLAKYEIRNYKENVLKDYDITGSDARYDAPFGLVQQVDEIEEVLGSRKETMRFLKEIIHDDPKKFVEEFDSKTKNRFKSLSQYFSISSHDLFIMRHQKEDLFNDSIDTFIEQTSQGIDVENKYFKPKLSETFILTDHDRELLHDESYIQGVRIAKQYDVKTRSLFGPGSWGFKDISQQPQAIENIKKLKEEYNISVTGHLLETEEIVDADMVDFQSHQNILKFLEGKVMSQHMVWALKRDQNCYMNELLQDVSYRETLQELVDAGFEIDDIFTDYTRMDNFKHRPFIDLLKKLKPSEKHLRISDFVNGIHHTIKSQDTPEREEYVSFFDEFELDTKGGCEKFLVQLQQLKKGGISGHFFSEYLKFIDKASMLDIYRDVDRNNHRHQRKPGEFLRDPALVYVSELGFDKEMPEFLDVLPENERKEWVLRIARNMHVEDIPATEENFKDYLTETILLRSNPEFTNIEIFKGRNVIALGHNEQGNSWQGERFLNDTTQKMIAAQNPHSFEVFKGDNTYENLVQAKNNFLQTVASGDNMTVIFSGHGGKNNIYLSDGSVGQDGEVESYSSSVSITSAELAWAFAQQTQIGDISRSIMINDACFSQNFIRNLYHNLEKLGVEKLPVIIGVSEYGQYGFGDDHSVFNDKFFEHMLDPEKHQGGTKIQDIIDFEQSSKENRSMNSNISIFFPIKNQSSAKKGEIHWQIAEADYMKKQQDQDNNIV